MQEQSVVKAKTVINGVMALARSAFWIKVYHWSNEGIEVKLPE
jgi:hypothetical protein